MVASLPRIASIAGTPFIKIPQDQKPCVMSYDVPYHLSIASNSCSLDQPITLVLQNNNSPVILI